VFPGGPTLEPTTGAATSFCPDLESWEGEVVPWNEAEEYVGQEAVVEGPVISAGQGSDGTTYINIGNAYPNPDRFQIVIPPECEAAMSAEFGAAPAEYFEGKTIRVYAEIGRDNDGAPAILEFCDSRCVRVLEDSIGRQQDLLSAAAAPFIGVWEGQDVEDGSLVTVEIYPRVDDLFVVIHDEYSLDADGRRVEPGYAGQGLVSLVSGAAAEGSLQLARSSDSEVSVGLSLTLTPGGLVTLGITSWDSIRVEPGEIWSAMSSGFGDAMIVIPPGLEPGATWPIFIQPGVGMIKGPPSTHDSDKDGILDDGDGSGDPTDNPCAGGDTTNCDDNCWKPNPNQEDSEVWKSGSTGLTSNPCVPGAFGSIAVLAPNIPGVSGKCITGKCKIVTAYYVDPVTQKTMYVVKEVACTPRGPGDGVGDACDNCPDIINHDQKDSDPDDYGNPDDYGDACDNCPSDYNPSQANLDKDSRGDVCDNCLAVWNSTQKNSDGDSWGDACDNCDYKDNEDQFDWDGDTYGNACDYCDQVPGGYWDSDGDTYGDECDNCPDHANLSQKDSDTPDDGEGDACDCDDGLKGPNEVTTDCGGNCIADPADDWDGDWVGNDCDCSDGYMGENELGADCGGDCTATCPPQCVPVINHGSSAIFDIVFIMASDYGGDWAQFRSDIRDVIENAYLLSPEMQGNNNIAKFNLWYLSGATATFSVNATTNLCDWDPITVTLAKGLSWSVSWKTVCPQGSVAAILHQTNGRDKSNGSEFSSEPTSYVTFIHESGHALYGLADEYDDVPSTVTHPACETAKPSTCCTTSYWQPSPHPNIYETLGECQNKSTNPGGCVPSAFTECQSDWWKSQPDNTIMNCCPTSVAGVICPWGPDALRRVNWVLDGSSAIPASGSAKAVVVEFSYDGAVATPIVSTTVYGSGPLRLHTWEGLEIASLDHSGELINSYTIEDPRYVRFLDLPLSAALLPEATAAVVVPYADTLSSVRIADTATGQVYGEISVRESIIEFLRENEDDPDREDYDGDQDGEPDLFQD